VKSCTHQKFPYTGGGKGGTLGKSLDLVDGRELDTRDQLKALVNLATWCWLDHKAWKSGAEKTSRKTTAATPVIP